MAQPPNPETIAALKKRVERLEELVLGLCEREGSQPAEMPHHKRTRILIEELNMALGMSPGTLEGRIETAESRQPESAA